MLADALIWNSFTLSAQHDFCFVDTVNLTLDRGTFLKPYSCQQYSIKAMYRGCFVLKSALLSQWIWNFSTISVVVFSFFGWNCSLTNYFNDSHELSKVWLQTEVQTHALESCLDGFRIAKWFSTHFPPLSLTVLDVFNVYLWDVKTCQLCFWDPREIKYKNNNILDLL